MSDEVVPIEMAGAQLGYLAAAAGNGSAVALAA
jgi:hypothetical protein